MTKLMITTAIALLAMPAFADTLPACERTDKGGYFTYARGCAERDSRDTDLVRAVAEEEPEGEGDGETCKGDCGGDTGGDEGPVDGGDETPAPEPEPAPVDESK